MLCMLHLFHAGIKKLCLRTQKSFQCYREIDTADKIRTSKCHHFQTDSNIHKYQKLSIQSLWYKNTYQTPCMTTVEISV